MFQFLLVTNIHWFCKSAKQSAVILAFQLDSRVAFLYLFKFISPTWLLYFLLFISFKQEFLFLLSFLYFVLWKRYFWIGYFSNVFLCVWVIYILLCTREQVLGAVIPGSIGQHLYDKSSSLFLWPNVHGNIPQDFPHWIQSITV